VPQWLWNCWEGNLIRTLVNGMNHGMDNQDSIAKKKSTLMDYLVRHIRVRTKSREVGQARAELIRMTAIS